jgi:hypothetical protein
VPSATSPSIVAHTSSRLRGSEAGRGLVEEEHGRPGDERRRQVQPPPHPARVGLRRALGGLDQVEALEQILPALPRRRAALAVEAPHHHEVLEAREVLVDGRVLPGEADPAAQLHGVADDVEPGNADGAGVGLEQRREHADRRRLAGAVGAQQSEHAARWRREVDPVQGPDVAEGLHQAGHVDRRLARFHALHGRQATDGLGRLLAAIAGMLALEP